MLGVGWGDGSPEGGVCAGWPLASSLVALVKRHFGTVWCALALK